MGQKRPQQANGRHTPLIKSGAAVPPVVPPLVDIERVADLANLLAKADVRIVQAVALYLRPGQRIHRTSCPEVVADEVWAVPPPLPPEVVAAAAAAQDPSPTKRSASSVR